MKIKCDFSLRHYQEILDLFKERGYKFCFFSEAPDKKTKKVYLRHDIDYSPETALRLAQIEYQKKIHSTYFIRLSAPFYNIFESKNAKIIKKIINLGHQIGLHFEINLSKKTIEREITNQIKVIQLYFDIEKIVSFHRPPKYILNQKFKNFISSYEAKFFKEIKYLSDSCGHESLWKEGCVCQWLKSQSCPRDLQILIHPIWWGRKEKDPNKYLHQYLKGKVKYLDNSLAKNLKIYKKKFLS